MIKPILTVVAFLCSISFYAQDYFPKNDGVTTTNTNYTALTNAKIYVTPTEVIEKGTILFKNGRVVATGTSVNLPKNTTQIDATGKIIYPSFIDMYSDFGIEKPKRQGGGRSSQYDPSRSGFYWNDHVMPEQNAIDHFKYDSKKAEDLIKAGFGVVNTHLQDGIVRGTGTLVALNSKEDNAMRVLDSKSGQYLSFKKSVLSNQAYPSSLMGSMALLRQLYYDAEWYANGHAKTKDLSLEALNNNKNLVQIFEAGSRANDLRADKVGDLFNIQYVILGGGDEYERLDEIKAMNAPMIIPINFPEAYDVENAFLASTLSVHDLRAWTQKPSNPKLLADQKINFVLTMHDIKSSKEFKENLLKAIEAGLSPQKALEALTTVPAQLLGQSDKIGSLRNGNYANFLVTSGDIFNKESTLFENWVQGQKNTIEDRTIVDITGTYEFQLAGETYAMTLSGESDKLKAEITANQKKRGSKVTYASDWINMAFTTQDSINHDFIRIVAHVDNDKNLKGKTFLPNGTETNFFAKQTDTKTDSNKKNESKDDKKDAVAKVAPITYPNNGYGFLTLPKAETILFKNATVWTNEKEGILEQTDVLIQDGKIAKIGKDLSDRRASIVDATGKHLTAGVIDEHSHIAAAAVNEGGQNSSAEVTMEDVLDDTDINLYRNLAGGVTTIQILHGSANPIGGRSAIIKPKWGHAAKDLIFDHAPKTIKFALGENVKQSNWSGGRFPQTRMGVEQVYLDYFTRAKAYEALKKSGKPYRKDEEMETLVEILNGERYITSHSYVQSEINMLMKVAEQFDFRINTFTHILEGYKVADKMLKHGVGASTFADWWAYKYEVNDAIPYNAAIMHEVGITVAINSDDAEMSRRLNQEAAKTIKYGGVSEEEAWKFVTLNPAKLLHIDDRVGSIKVGKDADVVLWTDNPLSIYAKAEKTIIEGVTYFDLQRDEMIRSQIQKEKSQLINEMLQVKNKGLKTQPITKKEKELMHCDSE